MRLSKLINPLKPDIIVFTGDSLNTETSLPIFKNTLKKLSAKIGKFAVRGNIDVRYFNRLDLFSDTGFTVLNQDYVELTKNNDLIEDLKTESVWKVELRPE